MVPISLYAILFQYVVMGRVVGHLLIIFGGQLAVISGLYFFLDGIAIYILRCSLTNFFRVETVDYAARRESFGNASSFYSSRFYYGGCFHSRNYWHVLFILFNSMLTHIISNLCGTCYCCSYDFRKPCTT